MIEEVAPKIYRIEIPLPMPFLNSMNAYVVVGGHRTLIIDTGMARSECMEAMETALGELGVDPEKSDFFMTHHHGDHFGLVSRLLTDRSIIYINRTEADLIQRIKSRRILTDVAHFLTITGFPEQDPERIIPPDAGIEYNARDDWPFRFIHDGDLLEVGSYRFRLLCTPGHSAGHTCLYEPDARILFSGDHVLRDITPGIQLRSDGENPLQDYIDSLERLERLDVELVLPGHRNLFRDYNQRIGELREHHRQRAQKVLAAVAGGGKNAYEVAGQIPWSVVDCDGWNGLPLVQQFFATGEAFSHLKFLEEKGLVQKRRDGEVLRYSPFVS